MKMKPIVRSLAAAGLITALGVGGIRYYEPATAQAAVETATQAQPAAPSALPDFSRLVKQYGPAVVNISVAYEGQAQAGATMPDFGVAPGDPFYEFFRRFQIPQNPQGAVPRHGIGSGFIVSPDGTILTNAHVVKDASEVTVKLTDRREFKAKVVGMDPQTDIAVLKIDANNLPSVKLGDSKNVNVGDWVVAIGSPYGFENSVTAGIVSAKARALPDGTYVPFIQTDVAVNPGNSGGPLFNLQGEVIGINSQIYSRSGGYQGLSFAIPIDTALHVKDQLVKFGKVTRGRLGVTIQEVNQSLASSFGMDRARGALVSQVENGSPADKAGVKPGDVVLAVDGTPIQRSIDLSRRIAMMKPGSSAKIEVWRDGKPRDLAVVIGEAPSQQVAAADNSDLSGARLGVAVRPLSPDEQKQAHVTGGVLVEQVAGAAARAGIRPGDIIVSVNQKPVKSVDELRAATKTSEKTLAILVQRDNARIFVPVELG
ncbi:MAG: DegQ family serine endoprotease [Burkholderiales bacterium]|nr:DegQ family serine endoprotease [Burkholderiales bacterium]